MEWLPDFLKQITISKSFSGAAFITSASLLFGPRFFPRLFEPLPNKWVAPATGTLVFSLALLSFWLFPEIWRGIRWTKRYVRSRTLTKNEKFLIFLLADLANEPLDLNALSRQGLPKLELLEWSHSLSKKGLVVINPYNENLITLSTEGRQRALMIKANLIEKK